MIMAYPLHSSHIAKNSQIELERKAIAIATYEIWIGSNISMFEVIKWNLYVMESPGISLTVGLKEKKNVKYFHAV